jgi:hypothetical protein
MSVLNRQDGRHAPEAGSTSRLHFGSRNRLDFAGYRPRRPAVVAVTKGRLDFGTWERIFYGEFDGRRRKRVLVNIVGA